MIAHASSSDQLPAGMFNLGDVAALGDKVPQPLPPHRWLKDKAASDAAGMDLWYPLLSIPALADKAGASRPHKRFFPDERKMFIQAFANECANFLFGMPVLIERQHEDGIEFLPNPEFQALPVYGREGNQNPV